MDGGAAAVDDDDDGAEEPRVEGRLIGERHAVIDDPQMRAALEARGYGDVEKGRGFVLASFESLYLVHVGRLVLRKRGGRAAIGFDALVRSYKRFDDDVLTRFLVYRDLRSRGYVVKDGFGFGSDFRVYERGHFGQKGAKYLVFALDEGRQERVGTLRKKVSEITRMGKEPIIAVIERRGEVIYYKISGIIFAQNRPGGGGGGGAAGKDAALYR